MNIDYGVADTPGLVNPTPMRATAGQPFSYRLATTSWPTPQIVAVGGSLPSWLTLSSDGLLSGMTTKAGEYDFRLAALGPYGETTYAMSVFVVPGATGHMTIDGITPTTTAGTRFPGTATGHWVDDYGNGISGVSFVALLLTDGPTATFDNGATSVQSVTGPDGRFSIGGVTAGPTPGTLDLAVAYAPFQYARVHLTITPANEPAKFGGGRSACRRPSARKYSYVVPTSGWPTPTVSVIAGELPPGLTIAADGTLSGTPSTAGNYPSHCWPATASETPRREPPSSMSTAVRCGPVAPTIGRPRAATERPPCVHPAAGNDSAGTDYRRHRHSRPGGRTAAGTGSPITDDRADQRRRIHLHRHRQEVRQHRPGLGPSNTVTPAKALAITTTSRCRRNRRHPVRQDADGDRRHRPYSWAIARGSWLPAGLTLHSNGTVTGTPTTAATRASPPRERRRQPDAYRHQALVGHDPAGAATRQPGCLHRPSRALSRPATTADTGSP